MLFRGLAHFLYKPQLLEETDNNYISQYLLHYWMTENQHRISFTFFEHIHYFNKALIFVPLILTFSVLSTWVPWEQCIGEWPLFFTQSLFFGVFLCPSAGCKIPYHSVIQNLVRRLDNSFCHVVGQLRCHLWSLTVFSSEPLNISKPFFSFSDPNFNVVHLSWQKRSESFS